MCSFQWSIIFIIWGLFERFSCDFNDFLTQLLVFSELKSVLLLTCVRNVLYLCVLVTITFLTPMPLLELIVGLYWFKNVSQNNFKVYLSCVWRWQLLWRGDDRIMPADERVTRRGYVTKGPNVSRRPFTYRSQSNAVRLNTAVWNYITLLLKLIIVNTYRHFENFYKSTQSWQSLFINEICLP